MNDGHSDIEDQGGDLIPHFDSRALRLLAAGRRDAPSDDGEGQRRSLMALGLLIPPTSVTLNPSGPTTASPPNWLTTEWVPIRLTGPVREFVTRVMPMAGRWMMAATCAAFLRTGAPSIKATESPVSSLVELAPSPPVRPSTILTESTSLLKPVESTKANKGAGTRSMMPTVPPLAEDLAALESARHALGVGDPATALRRVDHYHQVFSRGRFALETTVVRIEALVALGRRDEAEALGGEFLRRHEGSPYAERVRSLTAPPPRRPSAQ